MIRLLMCWGGRGVLLMAVAALATAACGQPAAAPTPPPAASPTAAPAAPKPEVAASPSPVSISGEIVVTANVGGRTITLVEVASSRVVANIPVGRAISRVALSPDGRVIFATDSTQGSRQVAVIDVASLRRVGDVVVGDLPLGIDVNPLTGQTFVANFGDGSVTHLETGGQGARATVQVRNQPYGVAVVSTDAGTRAFVTHLGDTSVSVIDAGRRAVVQTIAVGGNASAVAATPDGRRVVFLKPATGTLLVIDGQSYQGIAEVPLGPNLNDVAVTADGRFAYVTAAAAGRNLYKVDLSTNQVVQTLNLQVAVPAAPSPGATATPAASPGESSTPQVAPPSLATLGLFAVAASSDPGRVYVTSADNRLLIWDVATDQPLAQLPTGQRPEDVATAFIGGRRQVAPSPATKDGAAPKSTPGEPASKPTAPAKPAPSPTAGGAPKPAATPTSAPATPKP